MKITDPSFGKRFNINDRIIMKFMDFFLFSFLMLILLAKKGVFGGNKIITKSTHKRNKKHYQTINHSTTKTQYNILLFFSITCICVKYSIQEYQITLAAKKMLKATENSCSLYDTQTHILTSLKYLWYMDVVVESAMIYNTIECSNEE